MPHEQTPELGRLIETMAVTGARLSQLSRLTVTDLLDGNPADTKLHMPSSLKGKGSKRIDRTAVPIPAGLAVKLRQAVGERSPDAPLLPKPDGKAWSNSDLRQPFRSTVEQAKLNPNQITSYALRHTAITRMLVRGIPIRIVANLHDTSVPMIEAT